MKLSSLKIFRLDGIEDFQYMYRCTPGCKRLHMRRPFRIWKSSRTDFREIQAFLPAEWVDSGITQHFPEGSIRGLLLFFNHNPIVSVVECCPGRFSENPPTNWARALGKSPNSPAPNSGLLARQPRMLSRAGRASRRKYYPARQQKRQPELKWRPWRIKGDAGVKIGWEASASTHR